jgi:hypothetical protein
MDFLRRLLGDSPAPRDDAQRRAEPTRSTGPGAVSPAGQTADERAVERYRYLLRTAPPDAIEQAHAEAFAQLTPAQRRRVLEDLTRDLPPGERADRDDPQSLARTATRAELRRPGTLERAFGGADPRGAGAGAGGLLAGSFLSTVAGVVVGTAVANALFGGLSGDGSYAEGYQDGADADQDADQDAEAGDADGGDFGGDLGGDFGGGEA